MCLLVIIFCVNNPPVGKKVGVAVYIRKGLIIWRIKRNKNEYSLVWNNATWQSNYCQCHLSIPNVSITEICNQHELKLNIIIKERKSSLMCWDFIIDLMKPNNPQAKIYTDTLFTTDTIPFTTLPPGSPDTLLPLLTILK